MPEAAETAAERLLRNAIRRKAKARQVAAFAEHLDAGRVHAFDDREWLRLIAGLLQAAEDAPSAIEFSRKRTFEELGVQREKAQTLLLDLERADALYEVAWLEGGVVAVATDLRVLREGLNKELESRLKRMGFKPGLRDPGLWPKLKRFVRNHAGRVVVALLTAAAVTYFGLKR